MNVPWRSFTSSWLIFGNWKSSSAGMVVLSSGGEQRGDGPDARPLHEGYFE